MVSKHVRASNQRLAPGVVLVVVVVLLQVFYWAGLKRLVSWHVPHCKIARSSWSCLGLAWQDVPTAVDL